MSESTPHFAPIGVLLFLGAVFLIGISLLVVLYGAARWSGLAVRVGTAAVFTVVGGYLFLLGSVSLASSEKTLPPGGTKYFCEIDCHIAYSITAVRTVSALGPELQPTTAHGQFVIVRLKSWFDQNTISPHRGDSPLTPNRRGVVLLDSDGNRYSISAPGQVALARFDTSATPLTTPLRPGQSYTTDFVFDVPSNARGLSLLLTEDDPESMLIIGHENSFLHKKIYLGLDSAPILSSLTR